MGGHRKPLEPMEHLRQISTIVILLEPCAFRATLPTKGPIR
jgi:hypothetical protein